MKRSRTSRRIITILLIATFCLLAASLIGIYYLRNEPPLPEIQCLGYILPSIHT